MVDAFRLVMEGMEKVGNVATGTSTGNGSGAMGGKGTDKTLGQQLKKMAGIDLGVSALLKQSQIFTGYLGNIFAIVGALIDTILAPLAPIAFKALADLGKKIPAIAKMAEKYIPKVVEFLGSVARGIDNIMKVIHNDWAKWFGIALVTLAAINVSVRLASMGGRATGSLLGLRGGFLSQGAGLISKVRGGAAVTGATSSARIIAQGAGTRAAPIALTGGKAATAAAPAASRFARLGGVGRVVGGGAGGIMGGVTGYMGGRAKGMSQGKSIGRGIAGGAGGALGAALGSVAGPLGTVAGGMVGATAGNWLFDKLFDADKGKAGGGTDEMGQIGLAGYSAPMVVASAAQRFSDQVADSGKIMASSVEKWNVTVQETAKVHKEQSIADVIAEGKIKFQHAVDQGAINLNFIREMQQMEIDDKNEIKRFELQYLKELHIARMIESTAGQVGDLSFARGHGAGDVRRTATAMEFQAKQIVNEIKSDTQTGNYGIAQALGFQGDYEVSQVGNKISMTQGGKTVDLNITFGGADGSQQIIMYEQNGRIHQIKMEEDYSYFGQ